MAASLPRLRRLLPVFSNLLLPLRPPPARLRVIPLRR
jgi:hypothetical protein